MVVRKVANPAPSVLALVNPRKRRAKKMATKRKRSTRRRRVHHTRSRAHNPINPTRRHRRRRTHTVHARRRRNPINPTHRRRRHVRRRRNPFGGAGSEIINFTVAGIGLGLATPFVAGFAGRFLPFGVYNAPVISFGTGWLLSQAFKLFGFTRRFSHPAFVFGAATAAMQVLQPIVARTLGGGAANPMSGPYRRAGSQMMSGPMRGIGVWPGVPMGVPMIAPPAPAPNGMQGVGVWPGVPMGVPLR